MPIAKPNVRLAPATLQKKFSSIQKTISGPRNSATIARRQNATPAATKQTPRKPPGKSATQRKDQTDLRKTAALRVANQMEAPIDNANETSSGLHNEEQESSVEPTGEQQHGREVPNAGGGTLYAAHVEDVKTAKEEEVQLIALKNNQYEMLEINHDDNGVLDKSEENEHESQALSGQKGSKGADSPKTAESPKGAESPKTAESPKGAESPMTNEVQETASIRSRKSSTASNDEKKKTFMREDSEVKLEEILSRVFTGGEPVKINDRAPTPPRIPPVISRGPKKSSSRPPIPMAKKPAIPKRSTSKAKTPSAASKVSAQNKPEPSKEKNNAEGSETPILRAAEPAKKQQVRTKTVTRTPPVPSRAVGTRVAAARVVPRTAPRVASDHSITVPTDSDVVSVDADLETAEPKPVVKRPSAKPAAKTSAKPVVNTKKAAATVAKKAASNRA